MTEITQKWNKCSKISHLLSNFVDFSVEKIEILIKMFGMKHAFACHAVRHLSLQLHHEFQHFIVGLAGKQDFASVQLINSTPQ